MIKWNPFKKRLPSETLEVTGKAWETEERKPFTGPGLLCKCLRVLVHSAALSAPPAGNEREHLWSPVGGGPRPGTYTSKLRFKHHHLSEAPEDPIFPPTKWWCPALRSSDPTTRMLYHLLFMYSPVSTTRKPHEINRHCLSKFVWI